MNKWVQYSIGILGAILLLFGIWYFRMIVAYVFIAAAISIIGQPIIRVLEKVRIRKFRLPRGVTAAITLVSIWLLMITFFRIFTPLIINEANELSAINVNTLWEQLQEPLHKVQHLFISAGFFENADDFQDFFATRINSIINVSNLSDVFAKATGILGNLLVAFFAISFITFFFLKDSTLFNNGVMMFIPDERVEEVKRIMSSIKHLLIRYLGGILVDVLMVMTLITFGLWLVGVGFQHAVICGLFSGIVNVIPYVGPWIGAIFSLSIAFATNLNLPFQTELIPLLGFVLLVFICVQIIDASIFQPFIYSNSVRAHPLEIFLVIMMAGFMVGIGGMILAIPSYTVLRVIAKEFLSSFKIVQKLTRNI